MITSLTNGRIKALIELRQKSRVRNEKKLFAAEGFRIFEDAPTNLIKEIYVEEGTYNEMISDKAPSSHFKRAYEKIEECTSQGAVFEVLSASVFTKAADTKTPQGIIFVSAIPNTGIEDILSFVPEGSKGNILLLEDLQDPGNLGTMIRTAEAAGISGVILSKTSVDLYNPKTVRATMGAIFRVKVYYSEDLIKDVEALKKRNVTIYATDLMADNSYDEEGYEGRSGILIGNEGNGLSQSMKEVADKRVIIPMLGKTESLNASVAAALMMYAAR